MHSHQQDLLHLLVLLGLQVHLMRDNGLSVHHAKVSKAILQVLLSHSLYLLLGMAILVPAEAEKLIVPFDLFLELWYHVLLNKKLQREYRANQRLHDLLPIQPGRLYLHLQVVLVLFRQCG